MLGMLICVSLGLWFVKDIFDLSKDNILTILGFYFVFNGTLLVFTRININLKFDQRKAALDWMFGDVTSTLLQYELKLKEFLQKPSLTFDTTEKAKIWLTTLGDPNIRRESEEAIILILNFYERMSIGILKETFDEDICYDDRGFLLTNFYRWARGYVEDLRIQHKEPRLFSNTEEIVVRWADRLEHEHGERLLSPKKPDKLVRNRDIWSFARKKRK